LKHLTLSLCALAAVAVPSSAIAGGGPQPGDLLGATGAAGSSLVQINSMTGASSTLCPLGSLGPVTEIVYGADGTLYGTTGQGSSNLITIDPETCTETLVGQHSLGSINGLAFIGPTLYGTYFAPPPPGVNGGAPPTFLVTIDTTTGQETIVGQLGVAPWRSLAYDPATATLYGTTFDVLRGFGDLLLSVDPTDASSTVIGPIGFEVGGLRFGSDGTLYGGEALPPERGLPPTVQLISVDTATGAGTAIGPTSETALSGLAFVPVLGGEPAEIPALGPAGGLALLLLLAAAGLSVLRRG
jgi:hypothetical protein